MTCVAIIPARGGSKGIARKNLRSVGGISLLERSIIHARESRHVDRILVTSDDLEILQHARNKGAEIVNRPASLATDTANGDDVLAHALREIGCNGETPADHLAVLLLPTSPIRPAGLIDRCVEAVLTGGADSVFTAYDGHFAWHYDYAFRDKPEEASREVNTELRPVLGSIHDRKNRQEIHWRNRIYIENGSVYVSRTALLLKEMNRLCGNIRMVTMAREDSIDIDTEYDLWLAETRVRFLGERLPRAEAVNA